MNKKIEALIIVFKFKPTSGGDYFSTAIKQRVCMLYKNANELNEECVFVNLFSKE